MDSRRWLCAAVFAAALALPQAAVGAVRCVPATGPGCTSAHATINAAVTAAANDDTIRIAPGSYPESITTIKRLNFVGAGAGTLASSAGSTVIAPASGTALTLQRGGSVRSLRAVGATGFSSGGYGLMVVPDINGTFAYTVADVISLGGNGTDIVLGSGGSGLYAASSSAARVVNLSVSGSTLRAGSAPSINGYGLIASGLGLTASVVNSTVLGGTSSSSGLGVSIGFGATVDASGLTVQAPFGVQIADATVNLRRSRIEGVNGGAFVYETSTAPATYVTVTNSLITVAPTFAIDAVAFSAQTSSGSAPLSVPVRNSTIIARGVDPLYAVAARPPSGAPSASIDLRNSIARLEDGAGSGEADVGADRGTVTATHSDFATSLALNGGTVPVPGAGTNLISSPLFNAGAFTLQSNSPLIDKGDPSLVTPGELDLAGNPRSAGAAPDMGAYEYQPPVAPPPPPPNAAPGLTNVSLSSKAFRAKRGATFRYTLSEAATVTIVIERRARGRRAGKRCVKPTRRNARKRACKRWARVGTLRAAEQAAAQSTHFSGRFGKRALKPGRYRARIRAKDAAGARSSERRLAFTVLRPR
jgi:hypothetical protein